MSQTDDRKEDKASETEPSAAAESAEFESEVKAREEQGEDVHELRRSYLLRRFWRTARGFWGRGGRKTA